MGERPGEMPKMVTQARDTCVYCGGTESITVDHIPPKIMFPRPRSADLITVPACARCNAGFQKDDEYFFFSVVTPAAVRDPIARQLWYKAVAPLLDRSPKFKANLQAAYSLREHALPDGRVVKAKAVEIKPDRVKRVAERIVSGLLWHHGQPVPDRRVIEFHVEIGPRVDRQASAKESAEARIGNAPAISVAGGIFRYKYRVLQADPVQSDWFFEFYGAIHLCVVVLRTRPPSIHSVARG